MVGVIERIWNLILETRKFEEKGETRGQRKPGFIRYGGRLFVRSESTLWKFITFFTRKRDFLISLKTKKNDKMLL